MLRATIQQPKRSIQSERKRTNVLRDLEQPVLQFLCERMPAWVTSDILTLIGLAGSVIAATGFILAVKNPLFLWVSILGFAIQWFGDSLDGRVAYYRNMPRKWYGFSLDICCDWISTVLIGIGFYFYLPDSAKILAFTFVTVYGWAMLIAILKYKVSDVYAIDNGLLGPTEVRIILCLLLVTEMLFTGSLYVCVSIANVALFVVCLMDFYKLVQLGNERDRKERVQKAIAGSPEERMRA